MSGHINSMLIPKAVLGDLLEQLTGNELKVMLFLAVRTNGFSISTDRIRVREIAAGTKLSKKQVKIAVRVLTINAAFKERFQVRDEFSCADRRQPLPRPGYAYPQATEESMFNSGAVRRIASDASGATE